MREIAWHRPWIWQFPQRESPVYCHLRVPSNNRLYRFMKVCAVQFASQPILIVPLKVRRASATAFRSCLGMC
jgi:hypothetical protein